MIGNDIIDLRAAAMESRIHRKGFLEKLFLPEEIRMIRNAAAPAVLTWLLWSCKEAAYKIVNRNTCERRYAPQRFMCQVEQDVTSDMIAGNYTGTVVYEQHTYYYQSFITDHYIHTCAATNPRPVQDAAVFIKQVAGEDYLNFMQEVLSPQEFFYKDDHGIPYILHRENGRRSPVSVSHHGQYCGILKVDFSLPVTR
ncbi:phosphopantetheinyl transferase (holo-ACP synthase) [Chitinophaga sp. W2I13]|uniref:4'-phosphopantetheinyl transferase family protein n=1 Tax=unclassified Chitinophaga TaxID=2619133 RepID=UPI003D21C241